MIDAKQTGLRFFLLVLFSVLGLLFGLKKSDDLDSTLYQLNMDEIRAKWR